MPQETETRQGTSRTGKWAGATSHILRDQGLRDGLEATERLAASESKYQPWRTKDNDSRQLCWSPEWSKSHRKEGTTVPSCLMECKELREQLFFSRKWTARGHTGTPDSLSWEWGVTPLQLSTSMPPFGASHPPQTSIKETWKSVFWGQVSQVFPSQ